MRTLLIFLTLAGLTGCSAQPIFSPHPFDRQITDFGFKQLENVIVYGRSDPNWEENARERIWSSSQQEYWRVREERQIRERELARREFERQREFEQRERERRDWEARRQWEEERRWQQRR